MRWLLFHGHTKIYEILFAASNIIKFYSIINYKINIGTFD